MAKGQSRPRTPTGGGESRSGKKICFSLRVRVRVPPSAPNEFRDITLPRLGSRVRIPSPAPKFLKKSNRLERSFRAAFCFPARGSETGEAWGKQQEACRSGRAATFGICMASNVASRVEQSDGATESRICFLDCFPSLLSEGTDIFIQFRGSLTHQLTRRNESDRRTKPRTILAPHHQ
jgi:hypothetical protein